MIKTIVFDFDGVIVDSVNVKTEAFATLFKHRGEKVVKKVVDYHLKNGGVSRSEKFKYYYKSILRESLSTETYDRLCSDFASLVVEEVVRAPFIVGAKEFLENNSNKYRFYIVSGTPEEELKRIVKEKQLTRYFAEAYGSPREKADLLSLVVKREQCVASEVIFIGDAATDYNAAKKVTVNFVYVGVKPHEYNCLAIKDLNSLELAINHVENKQ